MMTFQTDILPEIAQKELSDFYNFLIHRYILYPDSEKINQILPKRPFGLAKNELIVSPDFNEPLEDSIESEFYK